MDEEALERTIKALVDQKNAADENSAAYRMIVRQLQGLRYGPYGEIAGGIIEDLDFGWGSYCRPL